MTTSLLSGTQPIARYRDSPVIHPTAYQIPSSSFASSLILSGDQGGLHTSLTSVSPISGRSFSALLTSCMITGPSGQPSDVSVIVTRTSPFTSMSASYTRPRSTMLIPISGSYTFFKPSITSSFVKATAISQSFPAWFKWTILLLQDAFRQYESSFGSCCQCSCLPSPRSAMTPQGTASTRLPRVTPLMVPDVSTLRQHTNRRSCRLSRRSGAEPIPDHAGPFRSFRSG